MKPYKKKLTLIELLIVIGIATLLMTIVIPSFRKMMTGSAVDMAAQQLKLGLERAQSQAVSSRRYVALILPNGPDWSTTEEKASRLGGFRMAYVTPPVPDDPEWKNWKFVEWVPAEKWVESNRNARLVKAGTLKADFTVAVNGLKNCKALVEDVLKEGASNTDPLKNITNYNNGGGTKNYCVVVFSPYGGIKGMLSDIYFAIAEAVADGIADGTALVYPGKGSDGPFNVKFLRVNRFTGAVEYYP